MGKGYGTPKRSNFVSFELVGALLLASTEEVEGSLLCDRANIS
jgi:hypothetical protein